MGKMGVNDFEHCGRKLSRGRNGHVYLDQFKYIGNLERVTTDRTKRGVDVLTEDEKIVGRIPMNIILVHRKPQDMTIETK